MNADQTKEMMLSVSEKLISSKEELCRLDSFIGDGDHGLTVERGFKAVKETLESQDYQTPKAVFQSCGQALSDAMGGAIGLIIGSLFSGGAEHQADSDNFDTEEFSLLLKDGLSMIQEVGEAKEGDRTLVDALAPASRAFDQKKDAAGNLGDCIKAAAEAAEQGAVNTKNMMAQKGRARFLREKSLGYVDAGATTMKLIIEEMSNYINK